MSCLVTYQADFWKYTNVLLLNLIIIFKGRRLVSCFCWWERPQAPWFKKWSDKKQRLKCSLKHIHLTPQIISIVSWNYLKLHPHPPPNTCHLTAENMLNNSAPHQGQLLLCFQCRKEKRKKGYFPYCFFSINRAILLLMPYQMFKYFPQFRFKSSAWTQGRKEKWKKTKWSCLSFQTKKLNQDVCILELEAWIRTNAFTFHRFQQHLYTVGMGETGPILLNKLSSCARWCS